jgi:hypothetical protein
MECWVDRSGHRSVVAEFSIIDLGFQGLFSAGLDANLNFCLFSISSFYRWTSLRILSEGFGLRILSSISQKLR